MFGWVIRSPACAPLSAERVVVASEIAKGDNGLCYAKSLIPDSQLGPRVVLLAVVLLAVVLAAINVVRTVSPIPARFKKHDSSIASASITELRCWRPADFLSHNGPAPRTLRAPMQLSGTRIMCAALSV